MTTFKKKALCLGCASIISVGPSPQELICCPYCRKEQKFKDYDHILNKTANAINYCYLCPTDYEQRTDRGREARHHYKLIECAEALKWIGLASLSGVIGAASWALVKKVIKKIIEQLNFKYGI